MGDGFDHTGPIFHFAYYQYDLHEFGPQGEFSLTNSISDGLMIRLVQMEPEL